jgi:hypothetical protein
VEKRISPLAAHDTTVSSFGRNDVSLMGKVKSKNKDVGSAAEEGFDAVEVFFGVDAYGVEVGGFDIDVYAVF